MRTVPGLLQAAGCRWADCVGHRAQAPDKAGFDEVMIVKYKSKYQFFHMALLDWHYWPLMCAACCVVYVCHNPKRKECFAVGPLVGARP